MILLATNKRDVTTDFVVVELRRRGLDFVRLNTEDLPECDVIMSDGDPSALRFNGPTGAFDLSQVTGAYYRRPGRIELEAPEAVAAYLAAEWSAVLRSLWNALEGRWLNSPFAILRAEDKPRQLVAARRAGFKVPETVVTNSFDAAKTFAAGGSCIGKPLRHALIDDCDSGRAIFTSRINRLDDADAPSIRRAPIILQHEIPKRADIRVIVIDNQVFATRILSQSREETQVDWRRSVRHDIAHEGMTLPVDAAAACVDVTRSLGLRFAAIDLVEDKSGDIWFLEANPNGQWAWIEQRTGAQITFALAEALAA